MNTSQRLKILIDSGRSVYTLRNLQELWGNPQNIAKISAKRMAAKGLLHHYAKGYYGLSENMDPNELANLIIQPSYISLHSALFYHSISFQLSNVVSSVALINYEKKIARYTFKYYSMKKSLFVNLTGIDYKANFSMAKPERALLDSYYFGLLPNIDNLDKLNFSYLEELCVFYPNSVQQKIKRLAAASHDKKRIQHPSV